MQRAAPTPKAMNTSKMNASKLSEANWSNRSRVPRRNVRRCSPIRFASPMCSTDTAFGRPVEPEV